MLSNKLGVSIDDETETGGGGLVKSAAADATEGPT